MSAVQMAFYEIRRRYVSFALSVVAVAVAVATMLNVNTVLHVYDLRAQQLLALKESESKEHLKTLQDEMRKATLKLSFNLVILPAGQNTREWHEQDFASASMPEDYVHRLSRSKLLSVRHFLPTLSQKVKWSEMNRTIFLVGCRGEVPSLAKMPRAPLVQPVPDGGMFVGYELQRSLGLGVGQKVRLLGREFTIEKCYAERGSKDDIGVWIPLKDAQELLGKPGRINSIMALECVCVGDSGVDQIRAEIAKFLPDTKVIELGTKVLARSEARARVGAEANRAVEQEERRQLELRGERGRLASLLVPSVVFGCAIWIFLISLINARQRRSEVAILRVVGCRSRQILALFLSRALLVGITGAVIGCAIGVGLTALLGGEADVLPTGSMDVLPMRLLFASFLIGALLGVVACWIPALIAARRDPAEILKDAQ